MSKLVTQDKSVVPVLPLRDIVVYPHMIVPLFVGRDKSVRALEEVVDRDRKILLMTQTDPNIDDPYADDLYKVGTLSTVLQLLKLPDGTVKVLIEGGERVRILDFVADETYHQASYEVIESELGADEKEIQALVRSVIGQFDQYVKLNRRIPGDVMASVNQIDDPIRLSDAVASYMTLKIEDKQKLLEMTLASKRLEQILYFIESEISVLQVEKRIRGRVKKQMEKTQREYYLNEQLKAIQRELGEQDEVKDELTELEDKIKKVKLSKEAREKAIAEVRKLRNMNPMSAEATVVRNYLDWLLGIPWNKMSKVRRDIKQAEAILNEDHYGLEKVKERILEYLAVQSRVGKMRSQILCLVGPPGVGKTSLGKSIARATGRNFTRMSLGGIRDEAEMRGHRRTYIGSMPGKIIQGMRKAKTSNPLFLLDEIDKLGADWRGDPSSALLEILDPEQNADFMDHYLEVGYDLSPVMFVTTANTLKMPQPLLDRMEIIRISGYTEDEKVEIARRHLLPKQEDLHGLKAGEMTLTDAALRQLIRLYTRESGVRNLERELANLARKVIKAIETNKATAVTITPENLDEYAGVPKYTFGIAEGEDSIGVTTGLAWTEVGGDLLSIEAVVLPGKGKMIITGKLGEVMQESIQAANSFVRSKATKFGLKPSLFEKRDIHIHVPEGATPKDGPSAGVAMCTSIVSVLTGIPVRKDVAMTGEITLRGRVLAIGGLKEKLLAAHRGGIKTVVIPNDNVKDLAEIPDNVKEGLEILSVGTVDEVLKIALTRMPEPLQSEEGAPIAPPVLSSEILSEKPTPQLQH